MDCRDVTALAIERLAGEAGEDDRRRFADHLARCESCRVEIGRLEDVWATLGLDPEAAVDADFRRRTLALLEEEMLRQRIRSFRPRPRPIRPLLQAAALLVASGLGWAVARLAVRPPPVSSPGAAVSATPAEAALPDLDAGPRLENVSYQAAGADGRVRIAFDVTSHHTLEGRPEEPRVARLLAYLVARNAETAGEKSRAIALVSEHYGTGSAQAAPEIVAALSGTLLKDPNPGVRKKAAEALATFAFTPEIRTVFLQALRADGNPAVRLVAVDALAAAARQAPDAATIESLREKAVDPRENGFVRAKAASALKAISF
jgi:hypothetical protein